MKQGNLIFTTVIILTSFVSCNNIPENKTKAIEVGKIETKDSLKPNFFLDFYFEMDQYEYQKVKERVIKDHPENFDSYGNFILQTKNIALKFNLYPWMNGGKLKEVQLWLIGDKKQLDLKKGSNKEVVILTGKTVSTNYHIKIPDTKVLTSDVSHINVPFAKELMGGRYGVVPRFDEFTSFLSTIEPKQYWDCPGYEYFYEGNLICAELVKLFSEKYNTPLKKDSTYISYFISGYRLNNSDRPQNPTYGDIYEIQFLHNIKTIESEYSWELPDKLIKIRITKGLIDTFTSMPSNKEITTDIKIIYAPKKQPDTNDSLIIKKNKIDSLRIEKTKEII